MKLNKELVKYNDRLYYVYNRIKKNDLKREEYIQILKEYWHCDIVVRQVSNDENILIYLREISDAELVD